MSRGDISGDPVVKTLLSKAGHVGSILLVRLPRSM